MKYAFSLENKWNRPICTQRDISEKRQMEKKKNF